MEESRLREALASMQFATLRSLRPTCLDVVDSTQEFALKVLKSDSEGDFVISKVQTEGRGRKGRVWLSERGGLWLTITLRPPDAVLLDKLSLTVASSILETLEERGLPGCSIKLPNDVYCSGRKIAGVLIDSTIKGEEIIAYAGIGVNVNNDISLSKMISDTATSVRKELGREVDLTQFTVDLLKNLDKTYSALVSGWLAGRQIL